MTLEKQRAVLAEAHSWRLTPYHLTAAVKGRNGGVDCARFIYEVFHATGFMPELKFDYTSLRRFIHEENPLYLETVMKFADEITEQEVGPGDVVMYRNPRLTVFTHASIVIEYPRAVIHAIHQMGVVVTGVSEGFLSNWEKRFFRMRTTSE